MLQKLLTKFFGTSNQRYVKILTKQVAQITALEPKFEALKDEEFKEYTAKYVERVANGETLESILPEAFALVREASKRVLGLRPYDVQLMGGIVLNQNQISEMKTGEGKTLTALLPTYLNALSKKGVHIVTVNDYLARRDSDWCRPLFEFLGMTVGCNIPGMNPEEKRAAYACDVTYGTNSEFGFDYLRDNMAYMPEQRVQRALNYALVDEVDSILIDEARTPLIISGPTQDNSDLYLKIDELIPELVEQEKEDSEDYIGDGHYYKDLKNRQVFLTENGQIKIEELMQEKGILPPGSSLFASSNILVLHHVMAALRAHTLFERNVDYIVKDGEIVIVDEHTGRTMAGRRWSEGLHQAIEAKERVQIQNENQTLASITYQNYFRMYEKLAGMTGTADTEAPEFLQIYNLKTVVLPTHRPMIRRDLPDVIYASEEYKYQAIVADIKAQVEIGRPVLVGTISIESSERLSSYLNKIGIKHNVLNAKFHEKEAEIVAEAGCPKTVTIATNMAGRGTDIVLGGSLKADIAKLENPTEEQIAEATKNWQERHDAVVAAGGLHIIGTERHESRRIDNQLRGRSGRQGDPGSSRFYLSVDDHLLHIMGADRVKGIMQKMGFDGPEPLEHKFITRAIETAQRKVETRNFDMRKSLLEFDDVANEQRKVVYEERNALLDNKTGIEDIHLLRNDVYNDAISQFIPPNSIIENWNVAGLEAFLKNEFALELPIQQWLKEDDKLYEETLRDKIIKAADNAFEEKRAILGEQADVLVRNVMLQALDTLWKEHLAGMDALRQGIGLRGYAQKDPKREYKLECYKMFTEMLEHFKLIVIRYLSNVKIITQEEAERMEKERQEHAAQQDAERVREAEAIKQQANRERAKSLPNVGRNDPCPCGSGLKFKNCCGKL